MTTAPTSSPRLAPPGAGLPQPELFFARALFRWHTLTTSRAAADAQFAQERDRILALVEDLSPERLLQPALIRRLAGLEDSSRNWSVAMTLEHLRIVNDQIRPTIILLKQGKVPARAASTAAVKPSVIIDVRVKEAFAASCEAFCAALATLPDLRTHTRFAHPWFGPLTAAQWHAMAGFHMRLHRGQITHILAAQTSPAKSFS